LTARNARGFFRAVRRLVRWRVLGSLAVVAWVFWGVPASAAPPSAADDASRLAELTLAAAHQTSLGEPLKKAKQALDRAQSLDQVGDARRAALLRATAREWLDLARSLLRTMSSEDKAQQAEKALDALETRTVRGRALLEETVARLGRAREALEQLAHAPGAAPAGPAGKTKGAKPDRQTGAAPASAAPASAAPRPAATPPAAAAPAAPAPTGSHR
jgi:hypothetical protein